jgi:hypothetical protein
VLKDDWIKHNWNKNIINCYIIWIYYKLLKSPSFLNPSLDPFYFLPLQTTPKTVPFFSSQTNPIFCLSRRHTEGRFTLWTKKSDQGVERALIGSRSWPGTTSVYTKKNMAEGPWRLRSLIQFWRSTKCIDMVQQVFRWERQQSWFGMKRQGPMAEKCSYKQKLINLFLELNIQLFPLCALIIP